MSTNIRVGTPKLPQAKVEMPRLKRTLSLTLFQVKELHRDTTRIGPLTCKEWSDHLMKYFIRAMKTPGNHIFNAAFPALIDLFVHNGEFKKLDEEEREMIEGMAVQFLGRFHGYVAEKEGSEKDELWAHCQVFITLKELSLKIMAADQKGYSIKSLISKANQALAKISKDHELPYTVAVEFSNKSNGGPEWR